MKSLKIFIITLSLISSVSLLRAEEGMWLPLLLKDQQFAQMRKAGLKLTPEEIYSVNKACLSNAVVGLIRDGGGSLRSYCTASFISDQGLLLTNYHCVISYIQRFSTPENDFLKYGYWASNQTEETICHGLEMKQLVRIEDVTAAITEGTEGLSREEYLRKIDENGKRIANQATNGTRFEAQMQACFGSSQYIMNIYKVYKDIRMVAAPPMSIGKFGGDDDNYRWPHHTGDFAILRVYSNENNEPKAYSKSNVFFKPPYSLKISLAGVKENDFAMVMGYPGSTREYIPSFALDRIVNHDNSARLAMRNNKIILTQQALAQNPELKFRYTAILSGDINTYLRWKGERQGVSKLDLVTKKQNEESAMQAWIDSNEGRRKEYGTLISDMNNIYQELTKYNYADAILSEAGLSGAEMIPFIGKFEKLVAIYNAKKFKESAANGEARRLVALADQFYKGWDRELDCKVFAANLAYYYNNSEENFKSEPMKLLAQMYNGDFVKLSNELYENSMFSRPDSVKAFLTSTERDIENKIKKDPLYRLAISFYMINVDRISRQKGQLQAQQGELFAQYMKAFLEFNASKALYPDANSSQRYSWGKVTGAAPEDGMHYNYFTTLDGAHSKYMSNMEDVQFYMPKKLRELTSTRDYGRYADKDGALHVNFLTNTHTTGGNSGSPVVNSKGELIGLNFDRIWQGVASDYRYDPSISRAIAVDVRYILFILDKYSPSKYVLDELNCN